MSHSADLPSQDASQQPPSIYRYPGFAAFLVARLLIVCALQVQAIVVAWQIYDITQDPLSLAWVGLAQFIPMLLLLLPAGDLIDRFDRKRILTISWVVAGLCSAALFALSFNAHLDVSWVYGVLVAFGCARAFIGPALPSILPQIVSREQLPAAIAANNMLVRGAMITGPLLGGFLYALGGGLLTYGVCAACFLAAVLLFQSVPIRPVEFKNLQGSAFERFTAGIHFIRSRPIVLGSISLDLFAVLMGGVVALLPIYAQDILHVGPTGLGALRSAMAIGEIGVGFYLSRHPITQGVGQKLFWAVSIFGLANLVFSLSHSFVLSLIALFIAGGADMVSMFIRSSLVQFSTPDEMRGRVNAVNMLCIGSSNELGEFRAGASAAALGVVPATVLGSLCTLGIVGLWKKYFPRLSQVNRFEDAV